MALTRVAPAGIGSTPGIGITIGNSFLHTIGLESINANFSGIVTAQSFRVTGDFQVDGTTTTLDTVVTSVDKLEVEANNNTVGVAITQSGAGDILNLYDGSTEVFTVTDGGNVGIGTNNPTQKFHILGNGNPVILLEDGSGTDQTFARYKSSAHDWSVGADHQDGSFVINKSTNLRTGTPELYIKSDGRIGIGTNNPTNTLDISKVGNHGIILRRPAGGSNSGTVKFEVHSNGAGRLVSERDFNINFDTDDLGNQNFSVSSNGSEKVRIKSDGKVGIGTNNPDNLLHLSDTNTTVWPFGSDVSGTYAYSPYPHELQIQNHARDVTGSFAGIYFHSGASPDGSYISAARIAAIDSGNYRSDLAFGTRNTNFGERLRIRYDGNIGIGTDNPSRILHVSSSNDQYIRLTSTNSANAGIEFGDSADKGRANIVYANSDDSMFFTVNGSEKLRITSGGDVGIGTDNPSVKLHVHEGSVRTTNTAKTNFVELGTDGNIEIKRNSGGAYIDFADDTTQDFDVRIQEESNGLRFITGGSGSTSERLRVGSDGKLTSTRTSTTAYDSALTTNDSGFLLLNNGAAGHATLQFQSLSSGTAQTGQATISSFNETAGSKNTALSFGTRQNSDATIRERLRITSGGKVGIGTNNPTHTLQLLWYIFFHF